VKNIVQVIFAIAMALLALLILKVERSARDERPCAVDAKGGVTCPAEEGTRARRRP